MINVNGKHIPLAVRLILIDIMKVAGVRACTVTSVARTPFEQANAMYENCIGTGDQQGVQHELDLYKEAGDTVIRVFVANRDKPREQIIDLMRQKIVELGPQTVSMHCADSTVWTVLDIGPKSVIPQEARPAFEAALEAAVKDGRFSKFLSPHTSDPGYHLELPAS